MSNKNEAGLDAQTLIGQLAQAAECVEKDDLSTLAKMHGWCETLVEATRPDAAAPCSTLFESASSMAQTLETLILGEAENPDQAVALVIETVSTLSGSASSSAPSPESARVETGESDAEVAAKLDALVDMVGELVIAQTLVGANSKVTEDPKLSKDITQVTKIVRDVQEVAMAMRMIPIGPTFQRMARLVRDVSRKAGKKVELDISGEEFTDEQAYALIFAPGFSTAAEVTDISGRGVGMDVVRRNIEQLRGRTEITSEKGHGSTFSICLPLTLAIIDGMVVQVGSERFIFPTITIEQALRPLSEHITTVQQKGEMLMVRGRLIPLIQLGELFGLTGRIDPCEAMVVIAHCEGRQIGVVVEELIGQQQVVIKTLGERFEGLRGISGAAILGDGRVGLILETTGLAAVHNAWRPSAVQVETSPSPAPTTYEATGERDRGELLAVGAEAGEQTTPEEVEHEPLAVAATV